MWSVIKWRQSEGRQQFLKCYFAHWPCYTRAAPRPLCQGVLHCSRVPPCPSPGPTAARASAAAATRITGGRGTAEPFPVLPTSLQPSVPKGSKINQVPPPSRLPPPLLSASFSACRLRKCRPAFIISVWAPGCWCHSRRVLCLPPWASACLSPCSSLWPPPCLISLPVISPLPACPSVCQPARHCLLIGISWDRPLPPTGPAVLYVIYVLNCQVFLWTQGTSLCLLAFNWKHFFINSPLSHKRNDVSKFWLINLFETQYRNAQMILQRPLNKNSACEVSSLWVELQAVLRLLQSADRAGGGWKSGEPIPQSVRVEEVWNTTVVNPTLCSSILPYSGALSKQQ